MGSYSPKDGRAEGGRGQRGCVSKGRAVKNSMEPVASHESWHKKQGKKQQGDEATPRLHHGSLNARQQHQMSLIGNGELCREGRGRLRGMQW